MMYRRCGSPRSTKYWRASLSAASIASDPPLTKKDMADARRGVSDEIVGQRLSNLCCEEARMRICKPVELLAHRCQDIRMRMAERGYRRAARGVDVVLARGVADGDALAPRGDGIGMTGLAVEDMSHDRNRLFLTCLKTPSKPLKVPQRG